MTEQELLYQIDKHKEYEDSTHIKEALATYEIYRDKVVEKTKYKIHYSILCKVLDKYFIVDVDEDNTKIEYSTFYEVHYKEVKPTTIYYFEFEEKSNMFTFSAEFNELIVGKNILELGDI